METRFVELERRFEKVTRISNPEVAAWASYLTGREHGDDWNAVLANRCAVVLGEAGSGKSWEFQAQVRRLRDAGHDAFFVRLDMLVHQSLISAVNASDQTSLNKWLRGKVRATFFLDSVDEARVTGRAAFHAALNNFANGLSGALSRAHLVVSCRVSEWRWDLDIAEMQKQLELHPGPTVRRKGGIRESSTASNDPVAVFSIVPLDRRRVELLATSHGIANVEEFSHALDDADAWDYVSRPGDMSDFAQYWIDKGRLGTLTQILEFTIGKRLTESTERDDKLAPDAVREAAEALAAGATFCKSFTFRTMDSVDDRGVEALDPQTLLPDWAPTQIRALQQRAFSTALSLEKYVSITGTWRTI